MLVACGLGLPLPEDIALITGGFLAGIGPPNGVGSLALMVMVGLMGILVGDSIIFRAGDTYGDKLLETRMGRHIPAERIARTRELFTKHGPKMIMVARFIPGVRAVTYFVAGSSHLPYWKFITYDGIAALVSAPLWVLLGHWAGTHRAMRRALAAAKHVQLGILAVAGTALLGWVVYILLRRRRLRRLTQERLLAASTTEPRPLHDAPVQIPATRAGPENA